MIKKIEEFIEESYGNIIQNEISEIDKLAVRYFESTSN